MINLIISTTILAISTIVFGFMFSNMKSKFTKSEVLSRKFQKKYESSQKKYESSTQIIVSPIRKGMYTEKVTLVQDENPKGYLYECVIYVNELDRYTNGDSKIIMTDIELVKGYSPDQYQYVMQGMTERFCTTKKTNDIEWLESEKSLKDIRKEKLKKLEIKYDSLGEE